MPFYVYHCECGERFNRRLSLRSGLAQVCPACGNRCKPVIQPVEFVIKDGTGAMRGQRPNVTSS